MEERYGQMLAKLSAREAELQTQVSGLSEEQRRIVQKENEILHLREKLQDEEREHRKKDRECEELRRIALRESQLLKEQVALVEALKQDIEKHEDAASRYRAQLEAMESSTKILE